MDEHPNVKILREQAEKMNAGDFQSVAEVLADDVVWHEIGRDEPIRGKEALAQRFQQAFGDFQIQPDVHDTVANDEHAVQLVNVTATRGGQTFRYRTAEIYHMKDGKITERWAFSDDTARIVEFFA